MIPEFEQASTLVVLDSDSAGMPVPREEFRSLDLEAHGVLSGVPLHDVSAIDLPGGDAGRTIADVRSLIAGQNLRAVNPAVRVLVALRAHVGRLFGWDSEIHAIHNHLDTSYIHRLSRDVKQRSALPPGSREGRLHLLYVLEKESLAEFRNATVHALFAVALTKTRVGYRLYWGVYVQPVSRLTPLYMALIASPTFPFGATSSQRSRPPVRSGARTAPWRTGVCWLTRCFIRRQ